MDKLKVTIICGGFSSERDISLKSGQQVAKVLDPQKYDISILELGYDHEWHKNNERFNKQVVDIAFIALHGKYGEDGTVQLILEDLEIPYTGSGIEASRWAMNKYKCLEAVQSLGIHTPNFIVITPNDFKNSKQIHERVLADVQYPCVVKPNESGSSIGISIVKKEYLLDDAIAYAFKEDKLVLIEQYIPGREFTCAVLGNTGHTDLIALPPAEIITHDEQFFDYTAKYSSKTVEEICPAHIDKITEERIQEISRTVHTHLACDGLTRSDFILSDIDNNIYFLEINTIPGMTDVSLSPKEAAAAGMSFSEFIEKQIELALKK